MTPPETLPQFGAPYAPDDVAAACVLLDGMPIPPERIAAIETRARDLIEAIRAHGGGFGGVEEMLREYSLSTREGLALMVLAEALLRVPDAATADRLIEDKLGQGDFLQHEAKSQALLVNASAWALGLSARIIRPGETPDSIIGQLAKRLGLPALRAATRQAMRVLGNHFVLGQTIDEALARARSGPGGLYRYSFDMLGEGARTAADAERYFAAYADAIDAIGRAAGSRPLPERPGISVKLSALHPRYEAVSRERVIARTGAADSGAGPQSQEPRPQFHHRRRGGRPAGTVARCDRRRLRRPVARRLGRFWPRHPGLSEAGERGHRLGRRAGGAL